MGVVYSMSIRDQTVVHHSKKSTCIQTTGIQCCTPTSEKSVRPQSTPPHLSSRRRLVHILFNNCIVATEYKSSIRHEATQSAAEKYLITKYKWNQHTLDNIAWKSHSTALSLLSPRTAKTTLQLMHQWLPVNKASSKAKSDTAKLCPFYPCVEETHSNYLTCKYIDNTNNSNQLHHNILKRPHFYSSPVARINHNSIGPMGNNTKHRDTGVPQ
jgi:hypothetical protein